MNHDRIEALRLLKKALHQFRPLYPRCVRGPVFNVGGRHQLAAQRMAGNQRRRQIRARRIDSGGIPRRACAEDQNFGVSGCVWNGRGMFRHGILTSYRALIESHLRDIIIRFSLVPGSCCGGSCVSACAHCIECRNARGDGKIPPNDGGASSPFHNGSDPVRYLRKRKSSISARRCRAPLMTPSAFRRIGNACRAQGAMTRMPSCLTSKKPNSIFMAKSPLSTASQPPHRMTRLLLETRWLGQIALVLFLSMALLSYSPYDPCWTHVVQANTIANRGGRAGSWTADLLFLWFGFSSWWWCAWLARRIVVGYQRITRTFAQDGAKTERARAGMRGAWIEAPAFGLVFIASAGMEALRMWLISTAPPHMPGGILGNAVATALQQALGLMGAALALLWIFAIGVSLLFRFSWLNVAERIGRALFAIFHFVQRCYSAWRDRKAGASAARQREAALEQDRMRMEAHEPVQIVSAVPKIEKSGHAQQEKQRALSEHTSSGSLPSLSLLDAPPPAQEAISADTLEFTSRLIEKKLQDFGVEVSVAAAYPGPVITRYEIEPAVGVKGSQIVNLVKDLARSLSLVSIR